jgi:hypothetical protein
MGFLDDFEKDDDNTDQLMIGEVSVGGLRQLLSSRDYSLLAAISRAPDVKLLNINGYPDSTAVEELGILSGLDPYDVYYGIKYLKVRGFIDMGGLVPEVIHDCAKTGKFQDKEGGFYSLESLIAARGTGKPAKPIEFDPVTEVETKESKRLRRILTGALERMETDAPISIGRCVESHLRYMFVDDPTDAPDKRTLRNLLHKAIDLVDRSDAGLIVPQLSSALAMLAPPQQDPSFPASLGGASIQGIIGEFVGRVLPHTEADENSLTYQLLTALGNSMGRGCFANFGADRHYPALFTLIVGATGTGKGQAWNAVKTLMEQVDSRWVHENCRYSAASGEGLVKLISVADIDKRLFLIVPEMSVLLNSMNREGSNLSGYLRQGYDLMPLENNKAKMTVTVKDYILSTLGHITVDELANILEGVDWYNGIANRFLWAAVKKSKTLPRMGEAPNFDTLGKRIRKLLNLPPMGHVNFSESGGKVWDEWVYALPDLKGKLAASQERVKANALRVALIYAAMDESRLTRSKTGTFQIQPLHVNAAIEVVTRSRQTVEWFLGQTNITGKHVQMEDIIRVKTEANNNGGKLTGTQLCKLLPHKTADQRSELATRAGLKRRSRPAGGRRGNPGEEWTW